LNTNFVAGSKREALVGRAATLLTNDIAKRSQKMAWRHWRTKKTMAHLRGSHLDRLDEDEVDYRALLGRNEDTVAPPRVLRGYTLIMCH
jgi:hypothetical protein